METIVGDITHEKCMLNFFKNSLDLNKFTSNFTSIINQLRPINWIHFCIINEHLQHKADSVYNFQYRLLQQIKSEFFNVLIIHYFSDWASCQYKNYKNMGNLCHHKCDFGFDAEWNFFVTAHGKSPRDGISGINKKLLYKASLQRLSNDQILTSQSIYTFCKSDI